MTPRASKPIVIAGFGSISPIGETSDDACAWYAAPPRHAFAPVSFPQGTLLAAPLCTPADDALARLRAASLHFQSLDRTVLMAVHAARSAVARAGWASDGVEHGKGCTGVFLGSSRGATGLLEMHHARYLADPGARLSPLASPTTTLGNLSSWVAEDCGFQGLAMEQSVTCSTAMHAIGTGLAWLRAGLAERVLAGGAEAPLTGFTLAQMQALRLPSTATDDPWPCRPCAQTPRNSMILGEGAAVLALERTDAADGRPVIGGFGFGRERLTTNTGISADGLALQASMRMAIKEFGAAVDAVVLHAPGTLHGDEPELRAVREVFNDELPLLASNKWILGHTLGASGGLSIGLAIHILRAQEAPAFPYPVRIRTTARPIRSVMVNATGFGGNAASLIVAADGPSRS